MRLYKTNRFHQIASKLGISNQQLLDAVFQAEQGLIDANLGGGVIKQRIAKQGRGKSAGFRSIIFYRVQDIAIFAFAFEKNHLANIDPEDSKRFKMLAKKYLSYSQQELEQQINQGMLIPIPLNS